MRIIAVLAVVLFASQPIRLSAQVGRDPGTSPYRDIQRGFMLRAAAGYFGGTRGKVPVAPSDGPTGGVRLEYQAGNVLGIAAGVSYAQTDAYYVTAFDSVPQTIGPVNSDLVLADFGVQVSVTGGKTVYGFQPYVGATIGLVFGSALAGDTSGYAFGTKFTYGPEAGVRWYPARRFSVELGGRLVVYRMRYPLSYRLYVLPLPAALTETTVHPWATFGVAWTF